MSIPISGQVKTHLRKHLFTRGSDHFYGSDVRKHVAKISARNFLNFIQAAGVSTSYDLCRFFLERDQQSLGITFIKAPIQPACFAGAISWLAFVVAIFMKPFLWPMKMGP